MEQCDDDTKLILKGQDTAGYFEKMVDTPCNRFTGHEVPEKTLEKLWATLTIEKLLSKGHDQGEQTAKEQKALKLAMKYNLLTPLTSLVIAKNNQSRADVISLESLDKMNQNSRDYGDTGFGRYDYFHSGGYDYYGDSGFHSGGYDYHDYDENLANYGTSQHKTLVRRILTSAEHQTPHGMTNGCRIELFAQTQLRGESSVLTAGKYYKAFPRDDAWH